MGVSCSGAFLLGDRAPSEELLAIWAEYAASADGLSLLPRREDCVCAEESATYDMADRAYAGVSDPEWGEFSIAYGRVDILRILRAASSDYTRGALRLAGGQASRTGAMCRKFDRVARNMVLSGSILLLGGDYMRPGDSGVCGVFSDESERFARRETTRRDLEGDLKEYSVIAVRAILVSSPY